MQPLGTKIIHETSQDQTNYETSQDKNHAASRNKKNHATPLKFLSGHFEFVTVYLGLVSLMLLGYDFFQAF